MNIIRMNESNFDIAIDKLLNREDDNYSAIDELVNEIIIEIKSTGDKALYEYTSKFDNCDLKSIRVAPEEIEEALSLVDDGFIEILKNSMDNIRKFHKRQIENSWITQDNGITLGQIINPLSSVGIYVPGGKASYPSTVLMNYIPAKLAGVQRIAMVTPPNSEGKVNPYILVAAYICGIDEIFKVGGAQGIAALAYGTESIKKVDKIVGPGNIYVARAKKAVFGKVDIDMIAGPSEVCVIADNQSNTKYIAADLLSQAEHDEMASSILITTSEEIAKKVKVEIEKQTEKLSRKDTIEKSIRDYGYIFVVDDIMTAIKLANTIAPEHLELMVNNPLEIVSYIKNAGAIFMGEYSPEPLGDYYAGPNHTLPTSGTAKFFSPLGVYDFIKRSSLISYNRDSLKKISNEVITFAETEGLNAHANSIKVRFENEKANEK